MESKFSEAWTRKDAYQHELKVALDALLRAKRIRFSFQTEKETKQTQTEKLDQLTRSLMRQLRQRLEKVPTQPEIRCTRSNPQVMLLLEKSQSNSPPIPPPPILYTETPKKRKSRWDIGPVTTDPPIIVQKRRFTRWDK